MNSAKLNDWMQVIGIFALVASLIFVGLQMQQDRVIAKVMIYQARASTVAEVTAALASSPDGLAAQIKSAYGDPNQEIQREGWAAPITAQEMISGRFAFNALLTLVDNSLFQYKEGFLPEDHWSSVRATIKNAIKAIPFARYHVESTLGLRRDDLRVELIEIMKEVDAEKSN
jgi:hypothetical protein